VEQPTIRPRIDDVARVAGVSTTAVSFAVNSPDSLAPETTSPISTVAEAGLRSTAILATSGPVRAAR
jgi:hypothetical protein